VRTHASSEVEELTDSFNAMTEQLRRSREELAAAERETAWREMAKQVAHEIRNPLTPMKLAAQHLQRAARDGAANLGDVIRTVTDTIIEQIEALARISDEFSRFARLPKRSVEAVDLRTLLEECILLYRHHDRVAFTLDCPAGIPPVAADRGELARAISNILRNAVQAMPEGGSVAVDVAASPAGIDISITDTGTGIPPELLPRIFEPNFSTKTDGMGMGLAIVKQIVADAGGAVRIASAPGRGTTAVISLPPPPGA
jgi:nitrogen fixation/metabolism regulation signal transduction histidine kinase